MIGSGLFSAIVVAAGLVLVAPTGASAQAEPTGRDFGHHVAACAQTSA